MEKNIQVIIFLSFLSGAAGGLLAQTFLSKSSNIGPDTLRVKELRIVDLNNNDRIILTAKNGKGAFLELLDQVGENQILLGISDKSENPKSTSKEKTLGLYFRDKKDEKTRIGLTSSSPNDNLFMITDGFGNALFDVSTFPEMQGRTTSCVIGNRSDGNLSLSAGPKISVASLSTLTSRITMKNEQDNLPLLYKDKFDNSAIKKIEF